MNAEILRPVTWPLSKLYICVWHSCHNHLSCNCAAVHYNASVCDLIRKDKRKFDCDAPKENKTNKEKGQSIVWIIPRHLN